MTEEEEIKEIIETFGEHWGKDVCLFVTRLRDHDFTDEQIASILVEIQDICKNCWDDDVGCQCQNDE